MSKLPVFSGRGLCRVLERAGYEIDHQTRSHIILRNVKPPYRRLTVPDHREISKGTLRAIIREAGLSLGELSKLSKLK